MNGSVFVRIIDVSSARVVGESQQFRYGFVNIAVQHRNLIQQKDRHPHKGAYFLVLVFREIQFGFIGGAEVKETVKGRSSSRNPICAPLRKTLLKDNASPTTH